MTTDRDTTIVTDRAALADRLRAIVGRISADGNFKLSEDEFAALVALCRPWPTDHLAALAAAEQVRGSEQDRLRAALERIADESMLIEINTANQREMQRIARDMPIRLTQTHAR